MKGKCVQKSEENALKFIFREPAVHKGLRSDGRLQPRGAGKKMKLAFKRPLTDYSARGWVSEIRKHEDSPNLILVTL